MPPLDAPPGSSPLPDGHFCVQDYEGVLIAARHAAYPYPHVPASVLLRWRRFRVCHRVLYPILPHSRPPRFRLTLAGASLRAGSSTSLSNCCGTVPPSYSTYFPLFSPSSHLKIISGSPIIPVTRLAGPAAAPPTSVASSFGVVSLLLLAAIIRSLFLR